MRHAVLVLLSWVIVACQPATGPTYLISGRAVAGPTCPVEPASPAAACAPRPVAGATILITADHGSRVADVRTGVDGSWRIALPEGSYVVEAQPVSGLMGTPSSVRVLVSSSARPSPIDLEYDTGIR